MEKAIRYVVAFRHKRKRKMKSVLGQVINMKTKTQKSKFDFALSALALLMLLFALSACGDSGGTAQPELSHQDHAWAQAYNEASSSRRPQKTFQTIDYTRSLYFDGVATLEQTQHRLFLLLQTSPALTLSPNKINQFVALSVDLRPHYRGMSANNLYRRYIR